MINEEKNVGISLLHDLAISHKGKLVWTSSYEALQSFVREALNLSDGNWSTPGGHAKLYQDEDIALKWYSDTKSIILSGKLAKEFEEKLNSMASISQELANEDLPFVNRTDKAVVGVQTATSGWDSSPEASFKHLESRLLKLSEDFLENTLAINNTLHDHTDQLNGLKNDEKVKLSALEKENHELKVENSALEERINNLSYILADLQGKVKHAEEEKASLITVIRLLNNNQVPNDRVGEQIDANLAVDQDQQNRTSEHLQPNIPVNNSFMVLNVEETKTVNNEPSISVYSKQQHTIQTKNVPTSKQNVSQSKHPTKRHENQTKGKVGHNTKDKQEIPQNNKDQNKRKIIIAGDSIIQHVHGWELSNCNVAVKSFSGSKIEDMQDYLKPLIRRKPDEIILHIGTNNIRDSTSDPQTLADDIVNLADLINSSSPSTQISISGLVTRRENSTFVSKINNTNKRLKAICVSKKTVLH